MFATIRDIAVTKQFWPRLALRFETGPLHFELPNVSLSAQNQELFGGAFALRRRCQSCVSTVAVARVRGSPRRIRVARSRHSGCGDPETLVRDSFRFGTAQQRPPKKRARKSTTNRPYNHHQAGSVLDGTSDHFAAEINKHLRMYFAYRAQPFHDLRDNPRQNRNRSNGPVCTALAFLSSSSAMLKQIRRLCSDVACRARSKYIRARSSCNFSSSSRRFRDNIRFSFWYTYE
jgi:hypothetical protein